MRSDGFIAKKSFMQEHHTTLGPVLILRRNSHIMLCG